MNKIEKINIFDTNELNRLQRAAKNKDKEAIRKWGEDFEKRINEKYYEMYKNLYVKWLDETFKDLDIAIIYSLHFNESTKFGNKRLKNFMDDLSVTVKGFYKKEFDREEYKRMLIEDGVHLQGE